MIKAALGEAHIHEKKDKDIPVQLLVPGYVEFVTHLNSSDGLLQCLLSVMFRPHRQVGSGIEVGPVIAVVSFSVGGIHSASEEERL